MSGTWVVGDVHGCAAEWGALVERTRPDEVVLVGDLFTKGPDPAGVWRLVRALGARAVLGNHDQRVLDARDGRRPGDEEAHRVLRALDNEDPSWEAWLRALPLWLQVGRFLVTHAALHPSGDLARTSRATHLAARRWPDDTHKDHPFWWEIYQGPPVLFGHDAVRGLVRREREGRPWVVGLDTGCVYGGRLTAFDVDSGEIVQEPARAVWCPVAVGERDRKRGATP
jgi:predicted phosphodiesterase